MNDAIAGHAAFTGDADARMSIPVSSAGLWTSLKIGGPWGHITQFSFQHLDVEAALWVSGICLHDTQYH